MRILVIFSNFSNSLFVVVVIRMVESYSFQRIYKHFNVNGIKSKFKIL